MNYLELVRRASRECGITNRDIITLDGQTGEVLRVKEWVNSAYEEIQNQRRWDWLWRKTSQALVIGTNEYSPTTDWTLSTLEWSGETLKLHDPAVGVTDRQPLNFVSWLDFSASYQSPESQSGRPTVAAVRPDGVIVFNVLPDKAYVFEGEYYKTSDVLSANTDVPAMPAQYHMAIVWGAVMLYAQYEEAGVLMQTASGNLSRFIGLMMVTELPISMAASPLA